MAKKITSTKKVCKIGIGLGVYLDKIWGFEPGDLVSITVEKVGEVDDRS